MKSEKEILSEREAKEELKKYDIYKPSDDAVESLLRCEKEGKVFLIDAFYDQFK